MNRSTVYDLICPDEHYRSVIDSIRKYRAVCRQVMGLVAIGRMAGATVEMDDTGVRLIPADPAEGAELLTATLGRNPSRTLLRTDLWPTAKSFVWDHIRRDVQSRWNAPDQQYHAKRSFLIMQGTRGIGRFRSIGIGMPQATARPVLDKHSLRLNWDTDVGPVVFRLPRLDGGRYYPWKCLRDHVEGWKLGTLYLGERKGKIRAVISYQCPDRTPCVDPERKMLVEIGGDDPESYIRMSGPSPVETDCVSIVEALAWVDGLASLRAKRERRRAAVGSPVKPWGNRRFFRAMQDQVGRITVRRANGQKTRNHLWTRRIVARAEHWRCGTIMLSTPDDLMGRPWGWAQFRTFLAYKIGEIGGTITDAD